MTQGGVIVRRMAADGDVDPGTAFRGADGQVAVRMEPSVTAGKFFVIRPGAGGYYEDNDNTVSDIITGWTPMVDGTPPTPPGDGA